MQLYLLLPKSQIVSLNFILRIKYIIVSIPCSSEGNTLQKKFCYKKHTHTHTQAHSPRVSTITTIPCGRSSPRNEFSARRYTCTLWFILMHLFIIILSHHVDTKMVLYRLLLYLCTSRIIGRERVFYFFFPQLIFLIFPEKVRDVSVEN